MALQSWKDKPETLFPRLVRNFFPYDSLKSPSGWEVQAVPEGVDIRYTVYLHGEKKIMYKKKNSLLQWMIKNSLPLDFQYLPEELKPIVDKELDTLGYLPKLDYAPAINNVYSIGFYREDFNLWHLTKKLIYQLSFLIQEGQAFWFDKQFGK